MKAMDLVFISSPFLFYFTDYYKKFVLLKMANMVSKGRKEGVKDDHLIFPEVFKIFCTYIC